MRNFLVLLGLFFVMTTASAQATLGKRNTQLNAGIGLSGWGVPVYLGFDYGASNDFTLGAEFSYRRYNDDWNNDDWKHTVIGIMVNGNYHFNRILSLPRELDIYAGLSLGYYIWSTNDNRGRRYNGSRTSDLGLYAQVGVRYFFTNNFGLNLELGGGTVSGAKLGITYKF